MKKILSLLMTTAVSVMAISSCEEAVIPEPDNRMTLTKITASTNPDETRTSNDDDGKISWTAGDRINVFFGKGKGSEFTTFKSGDIAEFTGSIDVITGGGENLTSDSYLWGVYPYNENNSSDGNSITLTLPEAQQAKAGSFADDLFPQIAKSQNFFMSFYNLCCCVRFKVTNTDIVKVTLHGNDGEQLAGEVKVSMDRYPVVDEIIDGSTELVMRAPGNGYFEPEKYYYFVLFPTEFEKGLTVTFHKKDSQASYSNTDSFTLERNTYSNINNADAELEFTPTEDFDIKIETLTEPWSYRYHVGEKTHKLHPSAFNKGVNKTINVDTGLDLTKMQYVEEDGNLVPLSEGIVLNTSAVDNTGAPIINIHGENLLGRIYLCAESSNTVSFIPEDMEFSTLMANYKFRFTLVNPETDEYYNVGFNVELGPKPADKMIDFGHKTVEGSMSNEINIFVEPSHTIMDIDKEFYSDIIPTFNNIEEELDIFNRGWEDRGNNSKPEGIRLEQPHFEVNRDPNGNIIGYHDRGRIVIYPGSYEAYYTLQHTYRFYGIDYTFYARVQLVKPNITLTVNQKFVDENNEVILPGKGILPTMNEEGYVDREEYHVSTDLRNYVVVDGVSLRNVDEVDIIYEVKDTYFDHFGNPTGLSGIFYNYRTPAYYMKVDDTGKAYINARENILDWFGHEQPELNFRPNEIIMEYRLVSRYDENIVFGKQEIKFSTPGDLAYFKIKPISKEYSNSKPPIANIAKALSVFDTQTGKAIYNAKANSLFELFDYRDKSGNTHGNAYNIYDIRFHVNESKIKMFMESGTDVTGQIDFTYDQLSGDFELDLGTANLTGDLIVDIPITMAYAFQGDMVNTGNIQITFKRAVAEEEPQFIPGTGQWKFTYNDGLWLLDLGVNSEGAAIAEHYGNFGLAEEDLMSEYGWNGEWGFIQYSSPRYSVEAYTETSGTIHLHGDSEEILSEIHYKHIGNDNMLITCPDLWGDEALEAIRVDIESPLTLLDNRMSPVE